MNLDLKKWIVRGLIFLGVLILFVASFGTIAQSEVGIKTRLGKVVGLVEPGPYLKLPFVEKVNIIGTNTRTINYDRNGAEGDSRDSSQLAGASKDLQNVSIGVVVNYRVDASKADKIFVQYKTVKNYEVSVAENLVRDTVKAISAQYTAEELLTKRTAFNDQVSAVLAEKFAAADATFERANITNIEFSKSFTEAIEAKVTAAQEAEKAKNKLEQIKFEAEQKVVTAKAEAESIRIQAAAVTSQGGADYVKLQWIEAWKSGGAKVPNTILGEDSAFMVNLQ